jgi:small GTP-binding protein
MIHGNARYNRCDRPSQFEFQLPQREARTGNSTSFFHQEGFLLLPRAAVPGESPGDVVPDHHSNISEWSYDRNPLSGMDTDSVYKVVVVGSSGVGKTCILLRLVNNVFDGATQPTIGIEYGTYTLTIDKEVIKMNIWDTAGQERFRSISRSYFRESIGAILVFAVNNADSFEDLNHWIHDLHQFAVPNAVFLVVGNKADLSDRQVTPAEAESFASRHGMSYLEVSALDGTNITESFVRLARSIRERIKRGEIQGSFEKPKVPSLAEQESTCFC